MKSTIKGGVWKNTEDEILKVAVMKYGKNQWARISSLLVRKSPAQCKARWYEWLDPSIKKTEWSKEEEEKLLHLAKIFPAQWKTIAPLVGRTASQCLEHYNRLLDQVQARNDAANPDASGAAAGDDPRRLRVGEVEANPETKPAKPDPIDMDEDEKETLSEAKARLSNTQGKKEKPGIIVHDKKKAKEKRFDYSQEIPFYRKPMAGFYDTAEEQKQAPDKDKQFINQRLDKIDGESRAAELERANKLEELKKKKREMTNLPDAIKQINKMNDPEMTRKRNKLVLPEPQLTDDDLQEIAEFEKQSKSYSAASGDGSGGELTATTALVGGLMRPPTEVPQSRLNMVARTPMREDVVMMEAQNLLAMTTAQTPLKGGANPVLNPSDFSGVTPKPQNMASRTPLRTPNPLAQGMTPRQQKQQNNEDAMATKHSIANGLKNLPAPVNKFQISLPDEPTLEEIDEDGQQILDQSEQEIREQQELKHKEQFRLRNRSLPLKKSLPRATTLPTQTAGLAIIGKAEEEQQQQLLQKEIDNLILNEMCGIIKHDDKCYPLEGGTNDDNDYEYFSEKELKEAQKLLVTELNVVKQEQQEQLDEKELIDKFVNIWTSVRDDYVYQSNQFVERASLSTEQKIGSLKQEYDAIVNAMKTSAKKAQLIEKKMTTELTSYQASLAKVLKQIDEISQQIEQSSIELSCFQQLRIIEQRAIESRVKFVQNQVYDQCDRENRNQMKYSKLINERNTLLSQQQQQNGNNNNNNNNNNHPK
ncbi:myb domain-containing protein [Heterostelium album PN500]|uniref:Myb domain-containing protein n=1 Tax=Heterostelium pallidum (strain ATCC 26659 / Pp 5 / PN500) TaxID=670386 RepID=D3B6X9_HETP5|nr:myb domain-containing protein [Heterostelium album PN500]EFA82522.1 myb domain-containing protein [Heterostelium album PN500]|eukprot:XP_020434639.1 myb domain-containing protein [Heterostelium album PN500]